MDRKAFNKITKEVFLEYGFVKKNQKYFLILQDVSLVVYFASWRGVKSFNYYFSINELYDETFPFEQRGDTLVEIKMEHDPSAQEYHKHEINLSNTQKTNIGSCWLICSIRILTCIKKAL